MSYLRGELFDEKDFPTFGIIRSQVGFVPNFYVAQPSRPDLIDAEVNLVGNLLVKESALARRQKEYIFLVCSAANLSTYCITAHCEIVRMLRLEGPEPEQIAIDHVHAKIPVADKTLLNFCAKLNNTPAKISSNDIDGLRKYGSSSGTDLRRSAVVRFDVLLPANEVRSWTT
jgi:uncharacterized peroxidase-related enzyme